MLGYGVDCVSCMTTNTFTVEYRRKDGCWILARAHAGWIALRRRVGLKGCTILLLPRRVANIQL